MTTSELEPRDDDSAGGRSVPALRASDADRYAAAETLREAAGDGRLDLDELNDRLDLVFAAKTHAQLAPVLADLGPVPASAPAPVDTEPLRLETTSGTVKRKGHWVVPRQITARCTSGNVKLDFTEAVCPHGEVTVEATARSGNVVMIVPRGWNVLIESASAASGNVVNRATDPPTPGAPTLRVHGTVRSGNVKVRYRYRRKKT